MRKLLLVTETGVMLVPERHKENFNELDTILATWESYLTDSENDTLIFYPEEPTPTIPGLITHQVRYPASKVFYIVDCEISEVAIVTPGIQIVGSMSNIKS